MLRPDQVILEATKKYKTALAFNGGKESLIVANMCRELKVDILWFRHHVNDPKSIIDFTRKKANDWNISLIELHGDSMKSVILQLKEEFNVEAIITGIKRTDPHGANLSYFSPTDPSWPEMIQVSPLLHFSYSDVWKYIHLHDLDVPKFYTSEGYTSVGICGSSFPNFLLWNNAGYNHASMLENGDVNERVARLRKIITPIQVSGVVEHGFGRGKEMGFPTANLKDIKQPIDDGVYSGVAKLNGKSYYALISVGKNITFDMCDAWTFEVHLLTQSLADFYDQTLHVTIEFFLRPMLKFNSGQELCRAIQDDIAREKYHRKTRLLSLE